MRYDSADTGARRTSTVILILRITGLQSSRDLAGQRLHSHASNFALLRPATTIFGDNTAHRMRLDCNPLGSDCVPNFGVEVD